MVQKLLPVIRLTPFSNSHKRATSAYLGFQGLHNEKALLTLSALALCMAAGVATAKEYKELRFGVDPSYAPFESKAADGSLVGFDIDLGNAICAELKVKCKWVESDFDGMIPGLNANKFDGVISSMTVTEAREKAIDFSSELFSGPTSLVFKKGANYSTPESLKGKSVGYEQGTIQEAYAKAVLDKAGVTTKAYANQDQVYADLTSGRLDASVQDMLQAELGFLKSPAGAGYEVSKAIDDPLLPSKTAVGIKKVTKTSRPCSIKVSKRYTMMAPTPPSRRNTSAI